MFFELKFSVGETIIVVESNRESRYFLNAIIIADSAADRGFMSSTSISQPADVTVNFCGLFFISPNDTTFRHVCQEGF